MEQVFQALIDRKPALLLDIKDHQDHRRLQSTGPNIGSP